MTIPYVRTRGLALLNPAGAVIGAMDSMSFDLITGVGSVRRRLAAKPRELTNDEIADARAVAITTRTPTMESCIRGYNRLK